MNQMILSPMSILAIWQSMPLTHPDQVCLCLLYRLKFIFWIVLFDPYAKGAINRKIKFVSCSTGNHFHTSSQRRLKDFPLCRAKVTKHKVTPEDYPAPCRRSRQAASSPPHAASYSFELNHQVCRYNQAHAPSARGREDCYPD